MLTNSHITTILPVVQMDRARRFYEEKLGLVPEGEHADGSFWMRGGDGSTVPVDGWFAESVSGMTREAASCRWRSRSCMVCEATACNRIGVMSMLVSSDNVRARANSFAVA